MQTNRVKNYFVAGILVIVPVWITFSILEYLITKFDDIMALLPAQYQPHKLLGFHIPGLGLLVVLLLVFFTGMLVTNFIGRYVVNFWDAFLARIPLVRSIHAGVKQILSTMLVSSNQSFRKVLLIEFPRRDLWTLAFQTGGGLKEITKKNGQEMITVFVPTTPNPTGGYLMFIPRSDAIELDISVDEALKLIISLGVILPKNDHNTVSMQFDKGKINGRKVGKKTKT